MAGLTARKIETLKSPGDYPDAMTPGLTFRLTPAGARLWIVRYRSPVERDGRGHGKQRRFTIGKAPAMDLATAREKARETLLVVQGGEDPHLIAKSQKQVRQNSLTTVREALEAYIEGQVRKGKPRTRADGTQFWERERLIRQHVMPRIGDIAISALEREEVLGMKHWIEKNAGPRIAELSAEAVRSAMNWVSDHGIAEAPSIRLPKKDRKAAQRDRLLSDAEINALWKHTDPDSTFGRIVRCLLLTGQRRSEVAECPWAEIDGDTWTIPANRTKNGYPHIVHLTQPVLDLMGDPVGTYVFGKASPFSGWSRSKQRLDGRLKFKQPWTLHDLRRTAATGMAGLGIDPHVVEAVLNHISGKTEVAGIYNRHSYQAEKRAALEAWAGHVMKVVAG